MSEQITPNPSVPTQIVADGLKFPKFISNLGIIPTSYKDSMSYYECLAWLCKYLEETVIPTVNQNGEAVEELQSLYIQLNEYVTNYFENLDVQEEIDNKLDEMITSGELETMLGPYIDSIIIPKIDSFETDVNSKILQQNSKIISQDNDIALLNNRINSIASLPSGSTSGDAELIDIRVANDKKIYNSAGDSVRGQIGIQQNNIINLLNGNDLIIKEYFNLTIGSMFSGTPSPTTTTHCYSNTIQNNGLGYPIYFDDSKYDVSIIGVRADTTVQYSPWNTTSPATNQWFGVNSYPNMIYEFRLKSAEVLSNDDVLDINQTSYIEHTVENTLTQKNIVYVDKQNGNDTNAGTETFPYRTIQHAINTGAKEIIVTPDEYTESLTINKKANITIRPKQSSYSTSLPDTPKIKINGTGNSNCMQITNSLNIYLESFEFYGTNQSIVTANNTSNLQIVDSIFHDNDHNSNTYDGLGLVNTSGRFVNCLAYNIDRDGFNIHGYCNTEFIDCSAHDCSDDGISHHDGCTGYINGGEFYGCGKGGVSSPTHGAKIDVIGVYSHDNMYGLYALTSDTSTRRRVKGTIRNSVFKNNSEYDIIVYNGDLIGIQNIYDTKSVSIQTLSTFTEFNS